jgi:hypothetical protein
MLLLARSHFPAGCSGVPDQDRVLSGGVLTGTDDETIPVAQPWSWCSRAGANAGSTDVRLAATPLLGRVDGVALLSASAAAPSDVCRDRSAGTPSRTVPLTWRSRRDCDRSRRASLAISC